MIWRARNPFRFSRFLLSWLRRRLLLLTSLLSLQRNAASIVALIYMRYRKYGAFQSALGFSKVARAAAAEASVAREVPRNIPAAAEGATAGAGKHGKSPRSSDTSSHHRPNRRKRRKPVM